MAIRFNAWILALTCCLLASSAWADDENTSYLSINVGQSKSINACKSPWITLGTNCDELSTAYRLAAGYQFTPAWGFEISYGDLGSATSTGVATTPPPPAIGPGTFSWSLKAKGWAFTGTGSMHVSNVFSLFGKLGAVRAEINEEYALRATNGNFYGQGMTNTAQNRLTIAAGAQFDINPKTALRVQYENFGSYDIYGAYGVKTPKINFMMVSCGLVVKY